MGHYGVVYGELLSLPDSFFIHGIGSILVGGPLVEWIIGVLEGGLIVGGLSTFGAALYSIGSPKNSIRKYEISLK